MIDIKKGIIPWQTLLVSFFIITLDHVFQNESIFNHLIQGIVVGVFLHSLRIVLNSIYKKDTLGMGDIHLLMVITYYLKSIELSLYVIVIASYVTIIFMMIFKMKQLPFGPFIILSTIGVSVYQIFFI
jgi:prepilin signal peptidase PulO-like enzyme (type II secretory pathway)